MSARSSYRVVNLRAQPVELHVGADAVVVGPGGDVRIGTLSRQVEELARRGLVAVEEIAAKPARATPPTTSRSRRGGGKK